MFKTVHQIKTLEKALERAFKHTAPRRGIHIDRIHVTGPLHHAPLGELFYKAIDDQTVVPVGSQAVKPNRKKNPEDVYIRSKEVQQDGMANMLEIDCCPPKILQGHNFFGHADLLDYVYAIFCKQVEKFNLIVDEDTKNQWRTGQVAITGIHLTANFWCPEEMQLAIIQAIDENNSKGKKRDVETSITLGYVAKDERSKYHMATTYSKAALLEKDWKKPGEYQTRIVAAAKKSIRLEIKCYSQWLLNNDKGFVMRWNDISLDDVFFKLLEGYQINNSVQRLITQEEKTMLSKPQLRACMLWLSGEDLKNYYARNTVWKYATEVLDKTGVDIRANRRPDALPALNMREVLVKENIVPIPLWAYDMPERYWQPGRALYDEILKSRDAPADISAVTSDGVSNFGQPLKPDVELDKLAY